jgi:hypothetical protein
VDSSSHEPHQAGLTTFVGQPFVGCGVTEPVGVLVGCRQFPSSTGPDGGPLDARCSPQPRLRTRGLLLPGARVEAALRGSPVSWMRKMAR